MTQQQADVGGMGMRIAREFGFPVVVLLIVLWCIREAAWSLHTTVLVPVVESHTLFIRSTSETLKSLGETQDKQAETLHEIAEGQRDIQRAVGKLAGEQATR